MKHLILISIMALFLAGCSAVQAGSAIETQPHHHSDFREVSYLSASVGFFATTLAGLEAWADQIVRGRMLNDAIIVFQYNEICDTYRTGHNRVSFEVLEVIRGDINIGETIMILEPYSIENGVLFTHSNYMPSIPYQEYFFFLTDPIICDSLPEDHQGAFWVLHGERGRFLVPDIDIAGAGTLDFSAVVQNFSARDFGLGANANRELYIRLWQEVMEAYLR